MTIRKDKLNIYKPCNLISCGTYSLSLLIGIFHFCNYSWIGGNTESMQFLEVADVQGCEHIFVDIMRLIYGCNYFLVSSFFHDWIEMHKKASCLVQCQ